MPGDYSASLNEINIGMIFSFNTKTIQQLKANSGFHILKKNCLMHAMLSWLREGFINIASLQQHVWSLSHFLLLISAARKSAKLCKARFLKNKRTIRGSHTFLEKREHFPKGSAKAPGQSFQADGQYFFP